jgi:glycosyltransferase involved in cell wall biosynthesis
VALRRGGAAETVVEGVTGEFFDDPIPEGLADAVRRLNEHYDLYRQTDIKARTQNSSLAQTVVEIVQFLPNNPFRKAKRYAHHQKHRNTLAQKAPKSLQRKAEILFQ